MKGLDNLFRACSKFNLEYKGVGVHGNYLVYDEHNKNLIMSTSIDELVHTLYKRYN